MVRLLSRNSRITPAPTRGSTTQKTKRAKANRGKRKGLEGELLVGHTDGHGQTVGGRQEAIRRLFRVTPRLRWRRRRRSLFYALSTSLMTRQTMRRARSCIESKRANLFLLLNMAVVRHSFAAMASVHACINSFSSRSPRSQRYDEYLISYIT